jgi:two-component system sensor histidine kinase ChiS
MAGLKGQGRSSALETSGPAINDRSESSRTLKRPAEGQQDTDSGLQSASSFSLGIDPQETDAQVEITVTDTGIGIPEEAQERIFHSFEQVDGSVAREFSGAGLGLAITKELVELHGGDIRVESTEGRGSTFTVLLPCSPGIEFRASEDAIAESSSRLKPTDKSTRSDTLPGNAPELPQGASASLSFEPGDLSPGLAQGRTILVIDDDATNVEVLRSHLEHAGFSVMTASDGQHAFEVINGFEVDLILCDVMMPIVDGYTFATRVREDDRLRDIPLVFVSAKDRKSDVLKGYQAGASNISPSQLTGRRCC